jgi:FAD-dependent urate hydroxylase
MSHDSCHVAVIGAGPYGLAAVAQLRRRGVDVRALGDPMSFWRTMPAGMLLRSNRGATNMIELHGEHSLATFERETGASMGDPVPLERFVAYGEWVQARVAPDVERRRAATIAKQNGEFVIDTDDGGRLRARRVVVAGGIEPFPRRPQTFAGLPRELASHTADHASLGTFGDARMIVVGGGQSALESAALLAEQGASVEVLVRASSLVWLRGGKKLLGRRLGPILYAPTDVGPLWYSRLVSVPDLFRRLPRAAQDPIAARCIRPAAAPWLGPRLAPLQLTYGRSVAAAVPAGAGVELRLDDGSTRSADHVLLGTGYDVDITRYDFLPERLANGIRRAGGFPVLGRGLESSVAGLHFLGAPAAWSYGPTMRFVSGSWFAARAMAERVAEADRTSSRSRSLAGTRVGIESVRPGGARRASS